MLSLYCQQSQGKGITLNKLKQSSSGNTPISVIRRRYAGERWWQVEIEDLIGKYKLMVQKMRAIRNLHTEDAKLQGLVADVALDMVESLGTLNELYLYRDPEETNTNGGSHGNAGG